LTQIFVESCVDFEVAHLSVFRLPYLEVPTLSFSFQLAVLKAYRLPFETAVERNCLLCTFFFYFIFIFFNCKSGLSNTYISVLLSWFYPCRSTLKELLLSNDGWTHWEFSVITTHAGSWDCPTPDDKTVYNPGRPPVCVFPCRVHAARVVEGKAVVTCRFVLMPLSGTFQAGEFHKVVFATI